MGAVAALAAQIATINSAQAGSNKKPTASASSGASKVGSAGGSGGGRGLTQAVTINVNGTSFGRDQVRGLVDQIKAPQSDGGTILIQ